MSVIDSSRNICNCIRNASVNTYMIGGDVRNAFVNTYMIGGDVRNAFVNTYMNGGDVLACGMQYILGPGLNI